MPSPCYFVNKFHALLLFLCFWVHTGNAIPQLPRTSREFRSNTTGHLIFNTVSSLLQHWPNTIYLNGHTFVPATIPVGTLLHHGRTNSNPPPSPEFFAFDVEHSYVFCFWSPCVMLTYAPKRDLKVGYFDGTSASTLEGPRDFQDVLFNEKFIPPEEYDPWLHAKAMCTWANQVGLDGIIRMEPSFEAILCNINSDLELVSQLEIVYPETALFPGQPRPFNTSASASSLESQPRLHPRQKLSGPISPGPTVPMYPAPPGWIGKQRGHNEVAFEAIRAGMWHNRSPGEARIMLDYAGIVSAYDEAYTSLVQSRQGVPRSKHRLDAISASDEARLVAEVEEVLGMGRPSAAVNWPAIIQGVLDRYAERLEDLRYILKRSDLDPIVIVTATRQKILIMLTPYMVLPQVQHSQSYTRGSQQPVFASATSAFQNVPDSDWSARIYNACAGYATAGIIHRSNLTRQEERLARSLDVVQGAICSSIINIWATAFDSEDKPILAKHMVAEWRAEIEELMGWLDWHMWIKCDPPCGPGLRCVLATWPWEVRTGDEELGPMCRDYLLEE